VKPSNAFLGVASIEAVATKNELVVVQPSQSLSSDIRKAHHNCVAALSDSLREAIIAGKSPDRLEGSA